MGDWLLNISVVPMAVVILGVSYALAAGSLSACLP